MFVISLDYIVDLERIEPLIDEHLAFLDRYYSQGVFVASGRKEPRTGGVILANKVSRTELEALIMEDPFYREKVADYQITEFLPSKVGEGFEALVS